MVDTDSHMSIFDILACPNCKIRVTLRDKSLRCSECGLSFPIVNGVPVMLPDGSIPKIQHEADLQIRETYDPWVHRVILQSLLDNQVVVDIGAGNMALDDPCIIRTDVTLSPFVDLVADAHALPFLPESIDYIFSLAVFEHLHNPFRAAQSIYEVLKDGGFIYHECNFVFAYHGYPHHYFNASLQGLEQIFSQFAPLRKGVAPYQMPSFALEMILNTYLRYSQADETAHGRRLTSRIRQLLDHDLVEYDIYFSEKAALNIAAATYFAGVKIKSPESTLIPAILQDIWKNNRELCIQFPNINQLTTVDNILVWARHDGRDQFPKLAQYLDELQTFTKQGEKSPWSRAKIRSMPFIEPRFGPIGSGPDNSLGGNVQTTRIQRWQPTKKILRLLPALVKQGVSVLVNEGIGSFVRKLFKRIIK